MSKILSGLLGIFLVAGVVGGAAFALLSDSASLTNLALSTGTADLLIKLTEDSGFDQDRDLSLATFFDDMVPGSSDVVPFDLRNDATSEVSFDLTAMIPSDPAGDWDDLKTVVECAVHTTSADPDSSDPAESSGLLTLETWRGGPQAIPGDPLSPDTNVSLLLTCMIPDTAGNEVSDLSLSGWEFEFTGTQVTL